MKTRNMSWKRKGFILAFLAPTVIAFVLFYLYPIVTVFVTSFCKWDYTNITSPEFLDLRTCGITTNIFLSCIRISGKLFGILLYGRFWECLCRYLFLL